MSSEKRKAQLETINKKCKNQQISLLEARQLLIEMLNVYAQYPVKSEAEISREESLLQGEIACNYNIIIFKFVDRWEKGEIKPNEEELKLLEETYRLVPASIKQAENSLSKIRNLKQLTEDDIQKFIQWNKESVEKLKHYQPILKQLIEKEREREWRREQFNWFCGRRANFLSNH